MTCKLLLTFDVEDFINPNAVTALHTVLKMLRKCELKAIFFITGHMAEKLSNLPEIVNLLKSHEIGFHSSGHSVRPIIQEYTDVKSYTQAYSISKERETAHINPLTGKTEGEGGIYVLQDLFKPRKIEAYRAPGMSWTPPNLEALVDLGIKFDFSSGIATSEPVCHKEISFYPYTFIQHWSGSRFDYQLLLSAILRRKVAVFDTHPALYVHRLPWDSMYYKGNPHVLEKISEKPTEETASLFISFERLLQRIRFLCNMRLIETCPNLTTSTTGLTASASDVQRYYEAATSWPRRIFRYHPRHVRNHFEEFFSNNHCRARESD